MELPKNITQIGEADRTCKIYVEDYVVSYMKQLSRQTQDKGPAIALYGKYTKEQTLSYFFIYGACQILSISKEVRHLSQAQNQEVERLRQRYFPEYTFLGYHIFDGEMAEGMHILEQDTCRYIKGYACFYEKNDSMLAYMVDNKTQAHEPEQYGQEKYDRARARQEERRTQYEQRRQRQQDGAEVSARSRARTERKTPDASQGASLKMMRMSAAAVFAVLCLIGVAAVTRGDGEGTLGEKAKQLWAQLSDGQSDPAAPAQGDESSETAPEIHNSGTLMAENSLIDAIRQENQDAAAVSGQAVAVKPEESEATASSEAPPQESSETAQGQEEQQVPPAQEDQESESQEAAEQVEGEAQEIPVQGPSISEVEAQQPQEPVSYIIQQGDTLIGISTRQYGNDSYVQAICELNGITNADNIQIGQKILLP
ncbi:MAG: LysM peptidoglycan-binding domain-containing protein [bacterium]|nr:LysM peptidoglycan-binding domain-containing protein [bacterium]MCM1376244.1 LysM peptidoglycan-binding domain-containing protein [Muribaculum sp.]